MSTEDLLKPRYKVIADYPGSEHPVGEIIQFTHFGCLPMQLIDEPKESWLTDFIERKNTGGIMYSEDGFVPYPHLFKKLEWWEERKESDMPEYLKDLNGTIYKSNGYYGEAFAYFLPASKEEYENQNNKQ